MFTVVDLVQRKSWAFLKVHNKQLDVHVQLTFTSRICSLVLIPTVILLHVVGFYVLDRQWQIITNRACSEYVNRQNIYLPFIFSYKYFLIILQIIYFKQNFILILTP